jgi:hypothetical protein
LKNVCADTVEREREKNKKREMTEGERKANECG